MTGWTVVEALAAFAPGEVRVVEVEGVMIAVFNIDGEFHAIEDVCSHDGGEIASGCLVGDQIECPRHGARFSVRTGEVLSPPAYEDLPVFPVRVDAETVQVRDDRWD